VKGDDPNVTLEHLSSNVNTPETEFAPFPFGDEALYFSSTMAKRAEIYRTVKSGGDWSKATPIENFPVIETGHFCNGTLTPDANRFYFTICKSVESWGGLTTQCEIYVTRRVGKTWTAPERLPDYINEGNVTTTHPSVVHDNNTEILYFASNRTGGMGGMDIWYTTREISSTANDFTLPINSGSRINTIGDEITPFYDQLEGSLYFASNGQITLGGYDIFKVKGAKSQWAKAENAGTPYNSPADDFFFIKTVSGKGGFLVSNRTFGMEKITSTHEDIFSFTYKTPTRQWVAKGEVFDKANREMLTDVEVALYELTNSGQKRFLKKVVSPTGEYDFVVEPSVKYYVEAMKDGFFPSSYEFDTYDFASYTDFGAPLYLEPYDGTGGSEPVGMKEKPNSGMKKVTVKESEPVLEKPVATKTQSKTKPAAEPENTEETTTPPYATRGKSKADNLKIVSEAPRNEGTYYKIQIMAIGKFDPTQPRYAKVKEMRRLDTEFLPERKLNRVLMADYGSIEEAKEDLAKVKAMKDFATAFIVEYQNGERIRNID
jgi:hypothetical protein